MKYEVLAVRYGTSTVEAESEEEAYRKAEAMGKEDFSWFDDFEVNNVSEEM